MDGPETLPFDTFWAWLMAHPNCILRAGTPEAVVYDEEDLHWTFASEEPRTLVVQVLRGKRPVAELFLDPEQVAYVEALPQEREDEFAFELISEGESERFAAWFFVLVHGLDGPEESGSSRVH